MLKVLLELWKLFFFAMLKVLLELWKLLEPVLGTFRESAFSVPK
jgi:hypothetical protein